MPVDRLVALYPDDVDAMPVVWRQLRVPGPPVAYRLTPEERCSQDHGRRFQRRTIMAFDVHSDSPTGAPRIDRLALVDKVIPHSHYDLMCAEVSGISKATLRDLGDRAASAVWHSAYNFVDFVSHCETQRTYGLEGGQLHLALNCDPNTRDRESIQASKQFHLHLLYWTAQELAALQPKTNDAGSARALLQRRSMDPLAFLAPAVVAERLGALDLNHSGMTLLPFHPADSIHGCKPMGCLIRLSGWAVLKTPAFLHAINRIHACITGTGAELQAAFTDQAQPPEPWHRHPLLPLPAIRTNLRKLGFSAATSDALGHLAETLSSLSPRMIAFLKKHPSARRRHLTLNNPCYALNLYAPAHNSLEHPLLAEQEIYLTIQAKLFSAIGGAGLLCLNEIPCVRIVREHGTCSEGWWRQRTRFQADFARDNYARLEKTTDTAAPATHRFIDFEKGWCTT